MAKFFRLFLVVTMAISIILGTHPQEVLAQETNNQVCIIGNPDASEFPIVNIEFRATDSNYQAIKTLTHENVTINENGERFKPFNLSMNNRSTGLNLMIVIDSGSNNDLETTKAMSFRFLEKYGIEGLDEITVVYTGIKSTRTLITSTDFNKVRALIHSIQRTGYQAPTRILPAIFDAVDIMSGKESSCERANAILVFGSNQQWGSKVSSESIITSATQIRTPIYFIHNVAKNSDNAEDYKAIAESTKGAYIPISRSLDKDSGDLDNTIFNPINNLRGTYKLAYRSASGVSGKRDVSITIGNDTVTSRLQKTSYAVNVLPPKITIINPVEGSDFLRIAKVFSEPKFLYDQDTVPIEFNIEWPDGFERVPSKIRIIGITSTGDQTIQEIIETEYSRDNYLLSWNVDAITREGSNPLGVRVEVIDELRLESLTTPNHFTVTNQVPEPVAKQTTEEVKKDLQITQYVVYGLAGLILLLIALIIIFRKKIAQAFSPTGRIGMAMETVRKTIVGGTGRRKNPIARLEVSRPTVEIKSIFTESIKLGRDPNVSDYTFFTLNSECSVSGEHAQLIKKRDGWKIIGISNSGSPVFVDGQRINLHQEYPIQNGQMVELGYQDLGSALFKFVTIETDQNFDFADEAEFKPDTTMQFDDGYRRTQVSIPADEAFRLDIPSDQEGGFSEQDIFKGSPEFEDDFDALFDNLRES